MGDLDVELGLCLERAVRRAGIPEEGACDYCARDRIAELTEIVTFLARNMPQEVKQELLDRLDKHRY